MPPLWLTARKAATAEPKTQKAISEIRAIKNRLLSSSIALSKFAPRPLHVAFEKLKYSICSARGLWVEHSVLKSSAMDLGGASRDQRPSVNGVGAAFSGCVSYSI